MSVENKPFKLAAIDSLLKQLKLEQITMSRFVEILNETVDIYDASINHEYTKIYKRQYDKEYTTNGELKPNKLLGQFKIIEAIYQSEYESLSVGIEKHSNNIFIISEREVTGINGGSIFDIYECKSLIQKV
jgi:hypothetical protein